MSNNTALLVLESQRYVYIVNMDKVQCEASVGLYTAISVTLGHCQVPVAWELDLALSQQEKWHATVDMDFWGMILGILEFDSFMTVSCKT